MNSEIAEVRKALVVLAQKITDCHERLSPQHVGNMIYGLQVIDDLSLLPCVLSLEPLILCDLI